MSNAFCWRALLVVAVLGGAAVLVVTRPVRLGRDLRGATQIVLEAQDTPPQKVDGDTASRTLEVLRRRVDALGVSEPTLQRSGDRRIIVEPPGVADPQQAVSVVGRTAQLAFHPVLGASDAAAPTATSPDGDAGQELVLTDADGSRLRWPQPR